MRATKNKLNISMSQAGYAIYSTRSNLSSSIRYMTLLKNKNIALNMLLIIISE